MPQSVLDAFTTETGISVEYRTYDSMEEAIERIEAGDVFDVVNLDNRFIPALIETGLLAELDHRGLNNLKNISANFRDLVYDPGNHYSIPYNWGTTGLVVRSDRISKPITRWADLWDPIHSGQVALLQGQPREVLGLTLKSLGYSANSEDPAELQAALEHLQALKSQVIWLDSDVDSLASELEAGRVLIGMGYAGDVLLARQQLAHIDYILPEDGTLLWGENFVVPANSPRQAEASLFLNYLLQPKVAAQIANENYYATPNEMALVYIRPEIRQDPVIFPPNESLQNAEIVLPLSRSGQALYDDIWAAFEAYLEP